MSGADDAMLRLIFNAVAEDQAAWHKSPMVAWRTLYEAVINSEGGLEVLQEIQLLRDEVARLQSEVDRLNRLVPRPASLPVIEAVA